MRLASLKEYRRFNFYLRGEVSKLAKELELTEEEVWEAYEMPYRLVRAMGEKYKGAEYLKSNNICFSFKHLGKFYLADHIDWRLEKIAKDKRRAIEYYKKRNEAKESKTTI